MRAQVQLVDDVQPDDELPDILRVPSPPQRRLSRSSIDLRDLEQQQQQQMQPHDRVVHTDSAPSMMALENFPFKASSKNKSESFFPPLFSKPNFLHKPLECFHARSSSSQKKKSSNTLDAFTIENDNRDLARFIEDNYQYFKKQNGDIDSARGAAMAADGRGSVCRNLSTAQLQACSDSDFLTLKNNVAADYCEACGYVCAEGGGGGGPSTSCGAAGSASGKKARDVVIKRHKMAALSDSDFIVSFGNKSKKFTLKSKIPFAKGILSSGRHTKMGKYNVLDLDRRSEAHPQCLQHSAAPPPTPFALLPASFRPSSFRDPADSKSKKFKSKGLNNNLSKSLNGCHIRNNGFSTSAKSIQRVLSEGNEATTSAAGSLAGIASCSQPTVRPPQPPYDAFDMFLKLFQCEKNSKNLCDKQSKKFNYKIVVDASDYDCCDSSVLVNYKSPSCEKIKSLTDFTRGNDTIACVGPLSKSSSDQMVLLNPCVAADIGDAQGHANNNILFNINGEIGHVLVNNLVITSPPVTPSRLLSPKAVNREINSVSAQPCTISSSVHLNANVFGGDSDATSLSMEPSAASSHGQADLLLDLKATGGCSAANAANAVDASAKFIKNDLAPSDVPQKRRKNSAFGGVSSRLRKPSVTYDINVINKSQDFNLDEICPQRSSSYAARSGSTSSTSTCPQLIVLY